MFLLFSYVSAKIKIT